MPLTRYGIMPRQQVLQNYRADNVANPPFDLTAYQMTSYRT